MRRNFAGSLIFGAVLSAIAVGGLWLLNIVLRENSWELDAPRILIDFIFLTILMTLARWKTALIK